MNSSFDVYRKSYFEKILWEKILKLARRVFEASLTHPVAQG